MKRFLESIEDIFYFRCPDNICKSFLEYSAYKNCAWLNALTTFCVVTQIIFYILYIHIVPVFNPDFAFADLEFYNYFTLIYIVFNSIWAFIFSFLEKRKNKVNYFKHANIAIWVFMVPFLLLEATECGLKIGISASLYRFVLIFLILTFTPTISRLAKTFFLISFGVLLELVLRNLSLAGYPKALQFNGFVIFITFICVTISHILFTRSLKNYKLRYDLENSNSMLRELNEKLHALSSTDPLTKIANRRAFNEYIDTMWNESKRSGALLTIMMIDIDNFKLYNDRYGHPQGDQCLIQIAQFASDLFVRATDMVARYGGEEFVVFLPHSNLNGALYMAEKFRAGVEELCIESLDVPGGKVTISIGVNTTIATDSESKEDFIRLADEALYRAKAAGRNRVCFQKSEIDEL